MSKDSIFRRYSCRVCSSKDLSTVLSLGPTPLANAYISKEKVDDKEYYYPLDLYFCNSCSFIQLGHVVSPKILFSDYVYLSSTSKVFIDHFIGFSKKITKDFSLDSNSLVIDIGSNDGILLKPFKEKRIRVLGIEPARKIAKLARNRGINTIQDYLSIRLADKIVKQYGKASVITATNVFAHIDDLNEVIKAVKILLKEDGIFIIEAPYLIDFLKKKYFDLVYHEHLSYWSIKSLKKLFLRYNMEIFKVEKVFVHGGSIRVYMKDARSKRKIDSSVSRFISLERKMRLSNIRTYYNFSYAIEKNRIELLKLLYGLKKAGKSIAGYGAPAKGNTLLNFFNIGNNILDYIVDDSSWKQNLFTPGKRIPIKSKEYIKRNKVDYLLILAWNFADSIIENNKNFAETGGRFIVPVPKPKII